MHIIDSHVHVFPDEVAPAAIQSVMPALEKSGYINSLDGTVAQLEKSMSDSGIQQSVYLPLATKSTQTETLLEWAAQLQRSNPHFLCCGTLHPNNSNYQELLQRAKKLGLRGIKMHPVFQNFAVTAPNILAIFRACGEIGLPVVLHAGLDITHNDHADSSPQSLAKMLELCPETTFWAAHMGGCRQWDEVERYLVGKPIYLDTSLASQYLDQDQFVRIVRGHGVDRILFGSDSPWCSQGDAVEYIQQCGFSCAEKERIFSKNALDLLLDSTAQ